MQQVPDLCAMKYLASKGLIIAALFCNMNAYGQDEGRLIEINQALIVKYEQHLDSIRKVTDALRLRHIINRLEAMGWPGNDGEIIRHSAMVLSYDEGHEMARWVAHIIAREVATGRTSRTNDFRVDPKVTTGSAEEYDYFLTSVDESGNKVYDGFGFDRGHLAPSADFRWSQEALSESYYYSNMTPQRPEFNRDSWAQIEDYIRGYAIENDVDLYVVTGPVLKDDLPKVNRSANQVSIPEYHYKIAYDPVNQRAIGILMPNKLCEGPAESYVKPIREIEAITGLDFFPNLDPATAEKIETAVDYKPWLPSAQRNDEAMLDAKTLGKDQYNTLQAHNFIDTKKKVYICGTVVSTFKSSKNNVFINLDKRFPNAVFSVNIWSRDVPNFSYNPEIELEGKRICARGEVTSRDGVPQMSVSSEKEILFLDQP